VHSVIADSAHLKLKKYRSSQYRCLYYMTLSSVRQCCYNSRCTYARHTFAVFAGEKWNSWDIEKHGIQIDFVDSQGSHRSATYVVPLPARCHPRLRQLAPQILAGCCAGAEVE
jgi:hypothetical protein